MPLSAEEIKKLQAKAKQLRCDMVDVTMWAGGAHIGGALSMTDVLTALYYHYLNVKPAEPGWPERDRFVLSKGHGGVGLAAVLADKHGYELRVTGVPSMPYLRLTDDPSLMLHQRFCSEAARRGAYMTSHHNWFMSCAHTQEDLDRTLAIAEDAFAALEKSPEGQGGS